MTAGVAGLLALLPALPFARNTAWAQQGERQTEEKLISVLESDAPFFDKAKACQQLAVAGTRKAVPVLAGLLADEKLAHYARFGLEPIPDPAVDAALRAAMEKLEGKLLVGVINSIGVRRDAGALEALTGLLRAPDLEAARAAAGAIGRIASPKAARVLQGALTADRGALRAAVADACLPCAELLLNAGKRQEAVALYDAVRRAELPEHIQLAALRGAILARQAAGVELLTEKLLGDDEASFNLAIRVAREMPESEVTRALVAPEVSKLPPAKLTLVIAALGARGDKAALPAVLEASKAGSAPPVRLAAIRALGSLGDGAAVPVLLEAATDSTAEVAQAAQASLESLRGRDVDAAIVRMLERGPAKLRPALIELAGRRRIAAAVSALRKAAGEENREIRLAAIAALGKTIELEDLPFLTGRLAGSEGEETDALRDALMAAARRMPDPAACTEKLKAAMGQAPVAAKSVLLDALGAVSGAGALTAVAACARDANEKVREAAVRVMGEWRSEDAAPPLLDLIKTSQSDNDRLRAFTAISQLIRRLGFPKEQRIGYCQQAMELARRDDERQLVLDALAGVPAPETLSVLIEYMSVPALKEGSCAAAVTIAERLIRTKREAVGKAMKQVLLTTDNKQLAARARRLLRQAEGRR
jgi:HEAT repeat protein